jgi:addiction module HigA family antidote
LEEAEMATMTVKRPLQRPPSHPGILMREILDDHLKLPIAEAARRMHISRPSLYAVLTGHGAVTAEMALRFGKLSGGAPELYLHMQDNYALWHARNKLRAILTAIEPAAQGVITSSWYTSRHCEEQSDEAIQGQRDARVRHVAPGLLRCARSDR